MSEKPLVSLILPSLNVAPYIEPCLNSVTGQSLREIEIICVDAGSTDGTTEKIMQYASKDDRIRVLHSEIRSYGAQVNIGIQSAKGEYLGIIDTDDYVSMQMYEQLYIRAKREHLDYIKADFTCTRESCNGTEKMNAHLFPDEAFYNQVIVPGELPSVFCKDLNIWNGIYSWQFLCQHNIKLNETEGAAYQDIGFVVQVLLFAERAMYFDQPLYTYRLGRAGASSISNQALKYAYQEWSRLLTILPEKIPNRGHIFLRLLESFMGEYNNVLIRENGNYASENLSDYRLWFIGAIREAVQAGILDPENVNQSTWKAFQLLSADEKAYAQHMKMRSRALAERKQKIADQIGLAHVIIWGCGAYGQSCYHFCCTENINVDGFCDNNMQKWESTIQGKKVFAPKESLQYFRKNVYLIASKRDSDEIENQLLQNGISERQIVHYLPEI